jgi:hypothetical protein
MSLSPDGVDCYLDPVLCRGPVDMRTDPVQRWASGWRSVHRLRLCGEGSEPFEDCAAAQNASS